MGDAPGGEVAGGEDHEQEQAGHPRQHGHQEILFSIPVKENKYHFGGSGH